MSIACVLLFVDFFVSYSPHNRTDQNKLRGYSIKYLNYFYYLAREGPLCQMIAFVLPSCAVKCRFTVNNLHLQKPVVSKTAK